jgi:carboxyl-terminal processing protease
MLKNLAAALLGILLPCIALPLCAADEHRAASPKETAEFADAILHVAGHISDDYFIEISKGELVESTIRGLYRRRGAPDIPAEFEERLRSVGPMKDEGFRSLLIAVRKDLETLQKQGGSLYFGLDDLSNDRYVDLALEEMIRPLDGKTELHYGVRRFILEPFPQWQGVGVRLRSDAATGMLQVVTPSLGGPAYDKGLRAGDLILQITLDHDAFGRSLQPPKVISPKGLTAGAALTELWGQAGRQVRLTVQRPGEEKAKEISLTREHVVEETVLGVRRKEDDHWDYWVDSSKKLAYIHLSGLGYKTADELGKALAILQREKMKGLILDLRFNKTGLMNAAVDVSDLFIEDGVIASIRARGRILETIRAKHEGKRLEFPIVCLVNAETAGYGEVIAACLQDHQRAILMGERTQGACGIQGTLHLSNGKADKLVLTRASLYRPSGKRLYRTHTPDANDDEWGVFPEPKYLVPLASEERRRLADSLGRQTFILPRDQYGMANGPPFTDRQLEAALAYLRSRDD